MKKSKSDNLIGARFGRLTIIKATTSRDGTGSKVYLCDCDCGNEKLISIRQILHGNIKSCGCIRNEKSVARLQEWRKTHKPKNNFTRVVERKGSNHLGVCYIKRFNKYVAYINKDGTNEKKYFNDIFDAMEWRKKKEEEYGISGI